MLIQKPRQTPRQTQTQRQAFNFMTSLLTSLTNLFTSKSECTHVASLMMTSTHLFLLIYKQGEIKPIYLDEMEKPDNASWAQCVSQILRHETLKNAALNIVLPGDQYQLVTVDKPEAEPEDLSSVLRYAAKDYIQSNLEDVVIEYFDIPIQPFGQSKLNLIAAQRQFLERLVSISLRRCKVLNRITIDELAYKDIFMHDDSASLLVIHQPKEELLIEIVKDQQLYFFRRIRGFVNLNEFAELEIKQGAAESLSLEIQRSLDYFESQLRQLPIKRIYIATTNLHQDALIEKIGENFTIPVLPLKNRVADELPSGIQGAGYIPTVGAAKELFFQGK